MKTEMELWIARDKDGALNLFIGEEPMRDKLLASDLEETIFVREEGEVVELDCRDFPKVTWENSPIEVELKLKI